MKRIGIAWAPPKRPGECLDTSRISKSAKVRPEDIKIKVEVQKNELPL